MVPTSVLVIFVFDVRCYALPRCAAAPAALAGAGRAAQQTYSALPPARGFSGEKTSFTGQDAAYRYTPHTHTPHSRAPAHTHHRCCFSWRFALCTAPPHTSALAAALYILFCLLVLPPAPGPVVPLHLPSSAPLPQRLHTCCTFHQRAFTHYLTTLHALRTHAWLLLCQTLPARPHLDHPHLAPLHTLYYCCAQNAGTRVPCFTVCCNTAMCPCPFLLWHCLPPASEQLPCFLPLPLSTHTHHLTIEAPLSLLLPPHLPCSTTSHTWPLPGTSALLPAYLYSHFFSYLPSLITSCPHTASATTKAPPPGFTSPSLGGFTCGPIHTPHPKKKKKKKKKKKNG